MANPSRPTKVFDVRLGHVHGRAILVKGDDAYELDDIGTVIWRLCDGRHDIEQVAHEIANRFNGPLEEVRRDIREYVHELVQLQLLELGPHEE